MRVNAVWEPRRQRVGVWVYDDNHYAKPVVMEPKTDRFMSVEPCMVFDDKKELQSLMDDLWCMGLRPSARSDEYKAQLNTMRNHLNDMRALVFKDKRKDLEKDNE